MKNCSAEAYPRSNDFYLNKQTKRTDENRKKGYKMSGVNINQSIMVLETQSNQQQKIKNSVRRKRENFKK